MPIERMLATRSFLREFIEAVPGAVYAKDLDGRILLGNAGFAEAVGWREGGFLGKSDLDLLPDRELALAVMENDRQVLAAGVRRQMEEELRAPDGSASYWLSTKAPFTDDHGRVVGLVGVSINITERKRLEERERLLAQELEHRNKNLLAVVRGVVSLTRAPSVDAFRTAVGGRLEALRRAQGLLAPSRRMAADLRELVTEALAAYDLEAGERLRLSGPPVALGVDAAQALAMATHELATNAAKYGALSAAGGRVRLTTGRAGDRYVLEWVETGGPPVPGTPESVGFGFNLAQMSVEGQLGGRLERTWAREGLRLRAELPLSALARRRPDN